MSSNATCSLDIIPTFLLKSCIDSLITPITNIINLSFLEGSFPTSFKDALVHPLLKKHNLPHEDLSSYRPISNLNFLSKILERIILFRMNAHFHTFPSLCPLQSAYRKFHSTETALLRIYNDLLLASDRRQVTALVLLDLSSAFALASLSHALDSVYCWLTLNRLSVNPNKAEYLLIGTQQQRSKTTDSSLSFHGTALVPVSSARSLAVVFQSDLSFDQHIFNVCRSSFFHIRQLRQIRPSLDLNSSIQLANALVSSKLDYCNSLFYGLPDTSIKRLQRVQNSLARVIFPSLKRSDHITPALAKLHWLPIHNRIKFKIATITFKVLKNRQPSYLLDLLQPHNPQRSLRSSDKLLLDTPKIKTALPTRSFSHAAPSVWNSLPFDLRNSSSLHSFTTHLKTHLFPP